MVTCFNLTADAVLLVYTHHSLCPSTPAPSFASVPALAIEKFLSSNPLLNFFTGDRRCIFSEMLPQKLGLFCKSYFSEILPQKLALPFESIFSKMLPQNLTFPLIVSL